MDDSKNEQKDHESEQESEQNSEEDEAYNPGENYQNLKLSYNLSRRKKPHLLTAAMRIILLILHLFGKTVTFSVIEEVGRIHLRPNGLSFDLEKLLPRKYILGNLQLYTTE